MLFGIREKITDFLGTRGSKDTGPIAISHQDESYFDRLEREVMDYDESKDSGPDTIKRLISLVGAFVLPIICAVLFSFLLTRFYDALFQSRGFDLHLENLGISISLEGMLLCLTYTMGYVYGKQETKRLKQIKMLLIGLWVIFTLAAGSAQYFVYSDVLGSVTSFAICMVVARVVAGSLMDLASVVIFASLRNKTREQYFAEKREQRDFMIKLQEERLADARMKERFQREQEENALYIQQKRELADGQHDLLRKVTNTVTRMVDGALSQIEQGNQSDRRFR